MRWVASVTRRYDGRFAVALRESPATGGQRYGTWYIRADTAEVAARIAVEATGGTEVEVTGLTDPTQGRIYVSGIANREV